MRFVFILPLCLLIIFANLPCTTADYCRCECCTSNGCNPKSVGTHTLGNAFCSELFNCKQDDCFGWHPFECPPDISAPGQTRAVCVSYSERLLPTFILIIGMNLLIQLIKNLT
jgi:hypothetical protein